MRKRILTFAMALCSLGVVMASNQADQTRKCEGPRKEAACGTVCNSQAPCREVCPEECAPAESCAPCPEKRACDRPAPCRNGKYGDGVRHHGKFRGHGRRADGNPALKEIKLTEEQASKLKALDKTNGEKLEKVREKTRGEFKKLQQDYDKELAKILTPEQMKQYEGNRKAMRSHRHSSDFRGKRGNGPAVKAGYATDGKDFKKGKKDRKPSGKITGVKEAKGPEPQLTGEKQ